MKRTQSIPVKFMKRSRTFRHPGQILLKWKDKDPQMHPDSPPLLPCKSVEEKYTDWPSFLPAKDKWQKEVE